MPITIIMMMIIIIMMMIIIIIDDDDDGVGGLLLRHCSAVKKLAHRTGHNLTLAYKCCFAFGTLRSALFGLEEVHARALHTRHA